MLILMLSAATPSELHWNPVKQGGSVGNGNSVRDGVGARARAGAGAMVWGTASIGTSGWDPQVTCDGCGVAMGWQIQHCTHSCHMDMAKPMELVIHYSCSWSMHPDVMSCNTWTLNIIYLDNIARGAHLLPIYGSGFLPEDFHYAFSLDAFTM